MLYIDKLKSIHWTTFRMDILIRDNFVCQDCKINKAVEKIVVTNSEFLNIPIIELIEFNSIGLQVHHKCYRKNKQPWEYDGKDLISLCADCHTKIHNETKIPIYDDNENLISLTERCDRCLGSGWLPQFRHIQSGVCFQCYGEGVNLNKL